MLAQTYLFDATMRSLDARNTKRYVTAVVLVSFAIMFSGAAFGATFGAHAVVLASGESMSDPWAWSLPTVIAAVGLLLVAIGNTVAAALFFFKWASALSLLRQDFQGFRAQVERDFGEFRREVSQDFNKVELALRNLSDKQDVVIELRTELKNLRERMRNVEATKGG